MELKKESLKMQKINKKRRIHKMALRIMALIAIMLTSAGSFAGWDEDAMRDFRFRI